MLLFIRISQSPKSSIYTLLESGYTSHSLKYVYILVRFSSFCVRHLVLNFYTRICNSALKRYRNARNYRLYMGLAFNIFILKHLFFLMNATTLLNWTIWEITKWVYLQKPNISVTFVLDKMLLHKTNYGHYQLFDTKLHRVLHKFIWKLEIRCCEHCGEPETELGRKMALMPVPCIFPLPAFLLLLICFSKFLRRDDKISLQLYLLHVLRSFVSVCLFSSRWFSF